jgi:3-hydroxyisobutyrate dehydrogenase-like beta-hydroxyacid dehydrogenase
MAKNLIKAGYPLVVYDIRKEAMEGLSEVKYEKASSPLDVASRSSVVITMLPASPDVEEVVLGPEGVIKGAKSGDIVIDMSSSYPTSTKMISERLAAKRIRMLDAPVSGGTTGAEAGTLTIMVGGEKEDFEEFLPLFEALGRKIYYVDKIGAGHTVKALNNLCSACSICITGEALVVATKLGLDPGKVNEIINNSSGRSYSTDTKFPNFILNGTFKSGFTAGLMNKDVQMANSLARELHFPMLVGSVVEQLYNHAVGQGMADQGSGSVVKLMENWAGVKVRSK